MQILHNWIAADPNNKVVLCIWLAFQISKWHRYFIIIWYTLPLSLADSLPLKCQEMYYAVNGLFYLGKLLMVLTEQQWTRGTRNFHPSDTTQTWKDQLKRCEQWLNTFPLFFSERNNKFSAYLLSSYRYYKVWEPDGRGKLDQKLIYIFFQFWLGKCNREKHK